MAKKKRKDPLKAARTIAPDYQLMGADNMDELFFSGFEQSLGEDTRERMRIQLESYDYYDGYQHRDELGNLVKGEDLERPSGLDYDPTRYSTNYFKAIIDRKARWQMSGEHGVRVPRKQIDDLVDTVAEDYEPSAEQEAENERAENLEDILKKLWRENKMRAKGLQIARDRLIADQVPCKIVYNPNTGKLRWIFRPDYEFIPLYSDDDYEELVGGHFIRSRKEEVDGEEVDAIKLQTYAMYEGKAYLHEAIYDIEDLREIRSLVPGESDELSGSAVKIGDKRYLPLGLDFLPIVLFTVDELLASNHGEGEISELRTQNDILNQMNEDAIDSLKFEMFSMTALINAPSGTAEQMEIAPGAVLEARGVADSQIPEIKKIESGFRWKEAYKDTYNRVKSAMHEISGLPQIVPQELNFGGLNTDVLQILFQDIIADTEEHWLSWGYAFEELHEKSIRYLQARMDNGAFSYDKDKIRPIEDYRSEMNFVLPLPDNRSELVNLLASEMSSDLESIKGAMERLGVDDVHAKMKEIENEKMREMMMSDPYAMQGEEAVAVEEDDEINFDSTKERRNENGEIEVMCPTCGGSGTVISEKTGESITCDTCKGSGWTQPRRR